MTWFGHFVVALRAVASSGFDAVAVDSVGTATGDACRDPWAIACPSTAVADVEAGHVFDIVEEHANDRSPASIHSLWAEAYGLEGLGASGRRIRFPETAAAVVGVTKDAIAFLRVAEHASDCYPNWACLSKQRSAQVGKAWT